MGRKSSPTVKKSKQVAVGKKQINVTKFLSSLQKIYKTCKISS